MQVFIFLLRQFVKCVVLFENIMQNRMSAFNKKQEMPSR